MRFENDKQPDRRDTCSGAGGRKSFSCTPRVNLSISSSGRRFGALRGLTPAGRFFSSSHRLTKRILSTARLESSRSKRLGQKIGARHAEAGLDSLQLLHAERIGAVMKAPPVARHRVASGNGPCGEGGHSLKFGCTPAEYERMGLRAVSRRWLSRPGKVWPGVHFAGRRVAGQPACFGSRRPLVRIQPPRSIGGSA